ncbi:dinucleotide-binding protein [Streptomyces sp. NPDC056821]|uniref:dinucleotide-binding protein n=1 Tax=unclassified Streptomyces TaxID=2593676 RepID=UPI00367D0048
MNITVIGRGRVGGGLARLWEIAGHKVRTLGRDGGDASDANVVVVAVPGSLIGEALRGVTGLNGQVTIDATNLYTERDTDFPSLAHQAKSVVGGPTAKAFNTVFASAYELIGEQRVTPSNLYAADPDAKDVTARLIGDAGFDPVYVGDLDPGARLLEDSSGLTRALAGQVGPFFYRYGRPGEL